MTTRPDDLIGKHILVGLTYMSATGGVERQLQLHGVIDRVTDRTLHFQRADGGGEFSIPFDVRQLHPADPQAVYHLRTTGESVSNVDLLSTWTIHPPADR